VNGHPPELDAAYAAGDWARVEALCEERLAAMPATPWAAEGRARARQALGDEARTDALLQQALRWSGREGFAAAMLRERLVAEDDFTRLAEVLPEQPFADDAVEDRLLAAAFAHRRGDYARAAELARRALDHRPGDAAALNHQARALHNLGRSDEALAMFRQAVESTPRYPEGWSNLAHALRAGGKMEASVAAYRRALALRPGFRAAALNLGKTLLAAQRPAEAIEAFRAWSRRDPDDAEASQHEGLALHLMQRLDEALVAYRRSVERAPENGVAWLYLGVLHNQRFERDAAGAALQRAVALLPQDGEAWAELAAWHELENRVDDLERAVARGLEVAPRHPRLLLEAARLERRRGRPESALQRLQQFPATALPMRQRAAYYFEAARSLDRMQRAAPAFAAFTEANRIARASGLPPAEEMAEFDRMLDRLDAWPPDVESAPWTNAPLGESPTFLLGFPRSGITLLNTMLGCHPWLATLEEKPTLEACVAQLAKHPLGYPLCLDALAPHQLEQLRGMYWERVEFFTGARDGRMVLDTFPLRTLHVAAIARLFPNARVVFMQRHPADVVLSNFMQEYGLNPANAHFTDIAAAARLYARTMRMWERVRERLPLRVHALRYEDLVRDPRPVLSALLAFLGLPWNEAVMTGHVERARTVRVSTSSYHQVAEPLYDRSIDRWKLYRDQLQPVLPLLSDAATRFGYTF
jgi:tetratricopeptide (TPR) repeat protein